MLNVAKKLLLSLGVASLLISCRSEFGYKSGNQKSRGKTPSGPTFRIGADKVTVNIKGYQNSQIRLTGYCSISGSKVIDWDLGDGQTLRGESIVHEYAKAGNYVVKAVCRGSRALDASLSINAIVPGQGGYPGQYPNQNPSKGGSGAVREDYEIPSQPIWQKETYPTNNYPYTYPAKG